MIEHHHHLVECKRLVDHRRQTARVEAPIGLPGGVNVRLTQLYEWQIKLAKLDECQLKLRMLRYRLGYRLGKVNEGMPAAEEHPSMRHFSERASQWQADSDASVNSASSAEPLSPP